MNMNAYCRTPMLSCQSLVKADHQIFNYVNGKIDTAEKLVPEGDEAPIKRNFSLKARYSGYCQHTRPPLPKSNIPEVVHVDHSIVNESDMVDIDTEIVSLFEAEACSMDYHRESAQENSIQHNDNTISMERICNKEAEPFLEPIDFCAATCDNSSESTMNIQSVGVQGQMLESRKSQCDTSFQVNESASHVPHTSANASECTHLQHQVDSAVIPLEHSEYEVFNETERSFVLDDLASVVTFTDDEWSILSDDMMETEGNVDLECSIQSENIAAPVTADRVTKSDQDLQCTMKRLEERMSKSAKSLAALQKWDKEHGLPKSHSPTMVNSSRSRKQLQEGVILPKWNGAPLIDFRT